MFDFVFLIMVIKKVQGEQKFKYDWTFYRYEADRLL